MPIQSQPKVKPGSAELLLVFQEFLPTQKVVGLMPVKACSKKCMKPQNVSAIGLKPVIHRLKAAVQGVPLTLTCKIGDFL